MTLVRLQLRDEDAYPALCDSIPGVHCERCNGIVEDPWPADVAIYELDTDCEVAEHRRLARVAIGSSPTTRNARDRR